MSERETEPQDDSTTLWRRFVVELAFPVRCTRDPFAPGSPLSRGTFVRHCVDRLGRRHGTREARTDVSGIDASTDDGTLIWDPLEQS